MFKNIIKNPQHLLSLEVLKEDNTIKQILSDVTNQTNEKFKTELSVEDIRRIVESQFRIIDVAINVGDGVSLYKIGNIKIPNKRIRHIKQEDVEYINKMQRAKTVGFADETLGY